MNRFTFILLFTIFTRVDISTAQVPNKVNYQAIIKTASGVLLLNQPIGTKVSILQSTPSGQIVFQEIFNPNPLTNSNGLLTFEIGSGIGIIGSLSQINWSTGPYFLKTEFDPTGGTNYSLVSVSQILTVPYALHSRTADSLTNTYPEADPIFLASPAGFINQQDIINWNAKQDSLIAGNGISIINNTISTNFGAFNRRIGEFFGGGIIFHLYRDSNNVERGLIVSLNNQSVIQTWSNIQASAVGNLARSSWNGLSNSSAIVNQTGHIGSAAKLCLDLSSGGFSDWYLPSIDELSLLWQNKYHVNRALESIPNATLIPTFPNHSLFWSSTETDQSSAQCFNLVNGYVEVGMNKSMQRVVRAIRHF